ncbi:DNA translocase FtsK 4TM domain-containing protein [Paracoccus cavernae]|uniref:DNA translocase FtsK 4TM domain-containing protein n=1 Tax=Paracoccus cavernae TaxID=1571207 RepID=UPI00363F2507
MLVSYSPDDPSIMSATDQPATNLLGRFGAYVASALFMIAGYGSYMLSIGAIVWGLRLLLHRGEERLMRGSSFRSQWCWCRSMRPRWHRLRAGGKASVWAAIWAIC